MGIERESYVVKEPFEIGPPDNNNNRIVRFTVYQSRIRIGRNNEWEHQKSEVAMKINSDNKIKGVCNDKTEDICY